MKWVTNLYLKNLIYPSVLKNNQLSDKRLPSLGKKVELSNDIQPGIIIKGNGSLLAWSIENIIKNGIDSDR